MVKTKKKKVKIQSMTFECDVCGVFTLSISDIYFYASASDCGMCGSHGSVSVEAKCNCGKSFEIEVESW